MHERTWQFRLHDDNVIDCASYFEQRASEVAEAMNCRVVVSSVVRIENLRGNVRKIVGTALLEYAEKNIETVPKARRGHIPRSHFIGGR